ncbi:colicin-D [Escherichia coli]|nr:colicin-D [Escherichia coli]EEU1512860.1 colicin-D [Escherichia coli]
MNKMAIIDLAKSFLASKITAMEFSERICVERRKLYGVKNLSQDVLNCGEELFIAAERFEPDSDRADYEFDDNRLRIEVQSILEKFKL